MLERKKTYKLNVNEHEYRVKLHDNFIHFMNTYSNGVGNEVLFEILGYSEEAKARFATIVYETTVTKFDGDWPVSNDDKKLNKLFGAVLSELRATGYDVKLGVVE